jgi:hypothetical protein
LAESSPRPPTNRPGELAPAVSIVNVPPLNSSAEPLPSPPTKTPALSASCVVKSLLRCARSLCRPLVPLHWVSQHC